jgi:hypothetical protein
MELQFTANIEKEIIELEIEIKGERDKLNIEIQKQIDNPTTLPADSYIIHEFEENVLYLRKKDQSLRKKEQSLRDEKMFLLNEKKNPPKRNTTGDGEGKLLLLCSTPYIIYIYL